MDVRLGSILKTSLIDYPGKISSVVFFQGCNFRCGYCYNVDVVIPDQFGKPIPVEKFFDFLESRKGLTDGVVLLGGEPLVQPDIVSFAERVKDMGFLVKLDTNGSRYNRLKELVSKELVDYIAMDIKAPMDPTSYYKIAKCGEEEFKNVESSLKFLLKGDVDYELRTTVVSGAVSPEMAVDIAKDVEGAKLFVLQNFFSRAPSYIDLRFSNVLPYPMSRLEEAKEKIEALGVVDKVRIKN